MRQATGPSITAAAAVVAISLVVPVGTAPGAAATSELAGRAGAPAAAALAGGPSQAPAATPRVSNRSANARISTVLRARTQSPVLGSRFTMTVWDTATKQYIYGKRASASLRGASTTKVLTSVGALAALGPAHRFATDVRAGSTPDEVVIVAGGDPLLTSADLRDLAASTAHALLADDSSGTSATQARSASAVPTIRVRADDSLFGDQGLRSIGWRPSYVPGEVRTVGAFTRDDRALRDATRDVGEYFAAALRGQGLPATYVGEGTADPYAATIARFPGHSVAEAVSRTLLVSENDAAEMLFRHVAIARGLPATWAGARRAMAQTLRELRVPLAGVRIVDGSGLSLEGRLTAGALTSALNRALSPRHPRLAGLRGWLPVAGVSGTLKASNKRFSIAPSRCAAGLIQAKTGTVADAIALAGYARGADGATKVFVSIVNARPTRYTRITTRIHVDRAASSVTGCW